MVVCGLTITFLDIGACTAGMVIEEISFGYRIDDTHVLQNTEKSLLCHYQYGIQDLTLG